MKTKSRLFLIWAVYAAVLVFGTGVYKGQWLSIALIFTGSLFGMLLPKLIFVVSELMLSQKPAVNGSFFTSLLSMISQDSHSLIPTTRTGQLVYSYPFLFAFGLVSLYIVTSSSGWFGKALVLGMGLRLMIDLFMSNKDKAVLQQRWFSAFPAKLSHTELNIFVYGSIGIWVLLTILALKA